MVQVLPPLNPLAHKPRPSSFRCSPVTHRRTFPSPRELSFSQSKYRNAVERAAVRKLTTQIIASSQHSSLSKPKRPIDSTVLAVSDLPFASPSAPLQDNMPPTVPATPSTPLETENSQFEPEPKVGIFNNTTKSDELLDLTLAALHRIYIEDFGQDSSSFQPQSEAMSQPAFEAVQPGLGAYTHHYDQSPPLSCGSSVSSASSTPSALPTPPSMSPEFEPEIVRPNDVVKVGAHHTPCSYSTVKAKAQPIARTQSLPNNYRCHVRVTAPHPILEDKPLRWFLTELLRRSRASASVVQLALYYLAQARMPVGKILAERFKSEPEARTGEDNSGLETDKETESPLLDPRRLLLAALMLSTKMLHDHAPNNRAWARVCGLSARDVTACERALGQALNWELAHMFVGPVDESVILG